jgi:L-ascorbate metabolism protein UlaG (beta-lactamase superfamily)
VGHSCFRLRGRGATVLTDPFASSSGYSLGKVSADVVTVSNTHPHHSAIELVDGDPIILDGPGEYEVKGVVVTAFRTDHGKAGEVSLRNTAFVIEVDDVTICHLGDLANPLHPEAVELAKDANVLLVPVGGECTIGPAQAVQVISQIEPKLVVPMHFGTDLSTMTLDSIDHFLREMGLTASEPQAKLVVTPSSLPAEPTVTVLQYRQ